MKRKASEETEAVAAEAPEERPRKKATKEEAPAVRQPDFYWSGQPVYRCRLCGDQYERVNNLAAVEDHEATQHPSNARVSQILGPGGKPLIVVD